MLQSLLSYGVAPYEKLGPLRATLAPHWGALIALGLFLIAGLAVLDDYGVIGDEVRNKARATAIWSFLGGDNGALAKEPFYARVYGPSFELALLFAERALGLDHARGVYLFNHLTLHCFFLTGGLFAYLLARRLFGSSLIALFAMLVFLLHPRLYAHSFFNSKDIAFLSMFIIALYLAHRAFKRDTLGAFALLGVGVGIAVNLRIMGVVLLAAIPALRALDLASASERAERKRVLFTAVAFALASLLTAYALLPYLWGDPVGRAVEVWTTLSDHPHKGPDLFRGLLGQNTDFLEYVPVWFSITSPPFALLLGLVGAAAVLVGAVRAPRVAIRSGKLRFGLLSIGCVAATVAAVILLDANIYNEWRHLYYLWAPFALLAAYGLGWLASPPMRAWLRAAAYSAAGVGFAATLASMALIHPNQQVYFSFSVDRVAPEYLRTQYAMNYSDHTGRQALEWLLDNIDPTPDETPAITGKRYWEISQNRKILPDAARARIQQIRKSNQTRIQQSLWAWGRSARALHRAQVYGNTIFTIERTGDLQAVYDATRGREPTTSGAYDVYALDGAVALVMEPCAPAFIEQVDATLRATPVDPADLPPLSPWFEDERRESRGFDIVHHGAFFDGKCVASLPLPDYPIADFSLVWRPEPLPRESAREAMRRAKANGRLLARSAYDVYLADGELVYVQEPCDPIETEHPFRVSMFPQRPGDPPKTGGSRASERFWFAFHQRGALLEDGACVALVPVPDYPIAAIRTAQYVEGGDDLWEAAFSANPEPYAAASRAVAGSEPVARGSFDLHLLDGDLVYVKEPCEQADTESRFFLHVVPERVNDLPEERRELGFDNLDFAFFRNGAWFDGKCAARVALPPYPIASVRTGQHVSGEGEIWSAEFAPSSFPPTRE